MSKFSKSSKYTIVMPVYNSEAYLEQSITSIKNQAYRDFECIVIDDGSTDGSLALVERLTDKDKRFKVLTQTNKGPSYSRNRGLDLAKGSYILFLDSDDVFSKDLLKQVDNKLDDSNVDVVAYSFSVLDDNTGYISHSIFDFSTLADKKIIDKGSIIPVIFNTFGNQAWSKAFRKDFLIENGIRFNEDIRRAEDLPFTHMSLVAANSISVVNRSLVSYRVSTGVSSTDTFSSHYNDIYVALSTLYEFINKRLKSEGKLYASSYTNLFLENIYFSLYLLIDTDVFDKCVSVARKMIKDQSSMIVDKLVQPSLIKFYDALTSDVKQNVALSIASRLKQELSDKEYTFNRVSKHMIDQENKLKSVESELATLKRRYSAIYTRYNKIIWLPRLVYRYLLKIKQAIKPKDRRNK